MKNTVLRFNKVIVGLLFTFLCFKSFAQTESYIQVLTGNIKPGDKCLVVDEKFSSKELWASIDTIISSENVVTFELRYDTSLVLGNKPFKVDMVFDLKYKDSSGKEIVKNNLSLTLDYDTLKGKPYKGIAYYKFKGGHWVELVVKELKSKEIDVTKVGFLRIKNQVLVDRLYKLRQANDKAGLNVKRLLGADKDLANRVSQSFDGSYWHLNWYPSYFETDDYDLEYVFYDVKSALAIQYFTPISNISDALLAEAFKNNATRISQKEPEYKISNVFYDGYLLVRIRSYRYVFNNGEWDREEFPWHYYATDGIDGQHAIYKLENSNHNNLIWQYSASFAEEGKRKEVVSYFDAALKSRQTVTISKINNAKSVAVIAENVLDKLNRPAINVLPVPVNDETIHYYPALNKNASNQIYSYADFGGTECNAMPAPLSSSSGAGRYYSPSNEFLGNNQVLNISGDPKNIPDAAGYPFAFTQYTNDATGRIRKQGGVGVQYQPGSGHETTYYYGKPSQEDLDRLFGSEAGAADHYSKNMVVDANGQASVSYVDMAGKTVATALAGNSPQNVQSLESEAGSERYIRDELVKPNAIVRDAAGRKISFNSTILVPSASEYNFRYEFTGRTLEMLFGWNPEKKLCADCYYDVKFSISDDCGNAVPIQLQNSSTTYNEILVPAVFNYGNSIGNPNTSCAIVPPSQTGLIIAMFPKAGEYKVNYEMTMSAKALDYYMEYIKQAGVMKTITEFKKDYLKKIDITGCFSDCRTCMDKLGTQQSFVDRMIKVLQEEDNIAVTTDDIEWIKGLYNVALAKCSQAVSQNCGVTDGCADQRKMMLKDVTPGGQYMLYDAGTLLFKERNINAFVGSGGAKNDPSSPFVIIERNGLQESVRIGTLQEAELITYWKAEWAYILLKYHPEYCLLQQCESNNQSKIRDKQMLQTDDEVQAQNQFGWYKDEPLYTTFVNQEMALVAAPYVQSCVRTEVESKIATFLISPVKSGGQIYNVTDPNNPAAINKISLRQLIRFMVYCENKPTPNAQGQFPYIDLDCIPANPQCNKPLAEWRLFRNLYTAIKQAALRKPACRTNGSCTNCYIGVNAFSTLYNEKANPDYYPKLNDFIIEAQANGEVWVKYNKLTPVHNRCDVSVYKLDNSSGSPVAAAVATLSFNENDATNYRVVPGAVALDVESYFINNIVNNYYHNIDGTVPPSNCPNFADFETWRSGNGYTHYIKYIGKYPLLNKVKLNLRYYQSATIGTCGTWDALVIYEPLESGTKVVFEGGCKRYGPDLLPGSSFCISTPASCTSDSRWPYYFQKKRRFHESNDADDLTTVLNQGNNGSGNTSLGSTTQNYQSNCEAQADGWLEKLKGCFTGPDDPRRAQLRSRLIAVCVAGSDVTHPFGSSSVNPTVGTTPFGDHSFGDAIAAVMGSSGTGPVCNDLLIDFPLPYNDNTPLNDPVVNTLSQCGYNLLVKFQNEWLALGGSSNTLYPTLTQYIKKAYDSNFYLTPAQIEELMQTYITHCPLKRPIRIPGILSRCDNPQTPTCLTCSQLYNVEVLFHNTYPQYSNSLPNYYELLAAFINRTYQMNVAPSAVYAAVEKCKAGGNYNPGCSTDMCQKVRTELSKFYQVMPLEEYCKVSLCSNTGQDPSDVVVKLREHITTWLNIRLNQNHDFNYYNSNFFTSCVSDAYFEPNCWYRMALRDTFIDPPSCECTQISLRCCDYYWPLTKFRQLYPDPLDPKLLAYFFEMRRWAYCAPTNLPNISYQNNYTTLVNYFNGVLGNLIPYCMTDVNKGTSNYVDFCSYWRFSFTPKTDTCYTNIYNNPNTPFTNALCSSPITPIYQSDPDDCLRSTVNASLSNAEYAYSEYVKDFARDYREAYFAKCMSVLPSVQMNGTQKEYHYTLYYYDQSGNLVKTVPPKGVRPLSEAEVQETARFRNEGDGSCYKNAVAPSFIAAGQTVTVPSGFYPAQDDGPLTLEAWVKFNNTSARQVILDQFNDGGANGKAGYYAYIENGKIYFNIYGRSRETWAKYQVNWFYPAYLPNITAHSYNFVQQLERVRQFKSECYTLNNISSNGSATGYYHLVFQYNGQPESAVPIKIYVNGNAQSLSWGAGNSGLSYTFVDGLQNVPSAQVPQVDEIRYEYISPISAFTTWASSSLTIGATSRNINGATFGGLTGTVKQVRIYNSTPDAADIRRSGFDDCYNPSTKEGLVLWLPLANQSGGSTQDMVSGNYVSISAQWPAAATAQYPRHKMPTYYAYNSLNQVSWQRTPDAEVSKFWYDRLGRLVISQNYEQKDPIGSSEPDRYSYTKYDPQGRIIEVGEKIAGLNIYSIDVKDDGQLAAWHASGKNVQVTKTIYDRPDPLITSNTDILLEQLHYDNSRKRVVTSVYYEIDEGHPDDYNSATHYIYDVSGNVKRLYQENRKLPNSNMVEMTKTIDYDYDLISGKVNKVWYQKDKEDQYLHSYEYDPENRLIYVKSGRDIGTLRQDAYYKYYLHGPLARTELGHEVVQGIDYAYTLQGWLKGINGLQVNENFATPATNTDMGHDGVQGHEHAMIPADVFAYTLGYNATDYKPIATAQHPLMPIGNFAFNTGSPQNISSTGFGLYNGNIAYTSYANREAHYQKAGPAFYSYRYDQLNRLKAMNSHGLINIQANMHWQANSFEEAFAERVDYDPNGNILGYSRNGDENRLHMDILRYEYYEGENNNKLNNVLDDVPDGEYAEDIDNQEGDNYNYDHIGNLIADRKEKISRIQWTVYGKIRSIEKDNAYIEYSYDAAGNRISKLVRKDGRETITHYVRDAQGNVMAVYEFKDDKTFWKEQHIYGSSRLGMWLPEMQMTGNAPGSYDITEPGSRQYELSNHLGNVLVTISDKKIAHTAPNGTIDYYNADVISANDYYPFGMTMPGRTYAQPNTKYRYGFNGKELDKEASSTTTYDYGFRIYSPALGKFLSVDPFTKKYPMLTPYQFASNKPISGVDLDGLEYVHYWVFLDKQGNFIQKYAAQDFRQMTAEQISSVHHVSADDFYKEYSTSFGKGGRGAQYTYFRQGDDGRYQIYPGSYWEMTQNDVKSKIGVNGFYTGRGSITKYGGLRSEVAGTVENPYDFTQAPINIVDKWALDHDKSQASLIDNGNYGISLDGYQGPLEDVRDQIFEGDIQLYANFKNLNLNSTMIDPVTNKPLSDEAKVTSKMGEFLFGKILAYKCWKISQMKNNNDPKEMEKITIDNYPNARDRRILKLALGN